MDRPTTTLTLHRIAGADVHDGDTLVLAVTGEHTIHHLDRYRRTEGDGMRHAHCTDGTCCTVLDHHTYSVYRD
jgi:hypothetical protein